MNMSVTLDAKIATSRCATSVSLDNYLTCRASCMRFLTLISFTSMIPRSFDARSLQWRRFCRAFAACGK